MQIQMTVLDNIKHYESKHDFTHYLRATARRRRGLAVLRLTTNADDDGDDEDNDDEEDGQ